MSAALEACRKYQTVALPAVSCGVFGFPHDLAAKVIVRTIQDFLTTGSSVSRVDVVVTRKDVISELRKAMLSALGTGKVPNASQTSAADSDGNYS